MQEDHKVVQGIQQHLLDWFNKNKRDLPWRKTKDAYKIWVSEIMLQQTRVDTVIEYYNKFIERFPTVNALAAAEEEEVLKYWQGLGYYSRARNLHKGAKRICEQDGFGGKFPDSMEDIMTIPGIGSYTAGAVLSIAFNLPYPAVDGNVLRVFSRVFLIKQDIVQPQTIKDIQQKVKSCIPAAHASDFTEALMELGALICTPASPACLACPLFQYCKAREEGVQEELPVKSKKTKPRRVHRVVCLIQYENKILILKNPSNGLLGGLWKFPDQEGDGTNDAEAVKQILHTVNIPAEMICKLGTARHIFTHMDWDMHLYLCNASGKGDIQQEHQWVDGENIREYPLPKVYQKVLAVYLRYNNDHDE